ncbi:NAD-dependent epimerase/dehydratase family protein [Segetibacter sp. 3557_3]|uniref:NAD-dependent epimerase/dehydratase family protein n=1 Tax=Segetibacter sp. 3557_3 TaxID=2547429 RepID=UPI001FB5D634|nr:NAD-dependent epimerase/dehydratase family protein [Segetibacter sp. 3557_3]
MTETLSQQTSNGKGAILVTGGTGLVGSHLIKALLRQGEKVKALYRNNVPENSYGEGVQWVKGDILDIISLEEALTDVRQVYHCAAIISYNPAKVRDMFRVNIEGTANVVNACLASDVEHLCFVSSVAALGRNKVGQPVTEEMYWSEETNNSNYGKSKYLAEMEVWRGVGEGLRAVVVNPSIILGAGDWTKGSSGIFKSAYNEFPWYTEGVTGFVDVEDVVKIMTELVGLGLSGERFIISSENVPFKDVFTAMAKSFGKRPPHKKVNPLIAGIVWRVEKIKSLINHTDPLLTKETATSAQAVVRYDNSKLFKFLPGFKYRPVEQTIARVCAELSEGIKSGARTI